MHVFYVDIWYFDIILYFVDVWYFDIICIFVFLYLIMELGGISVYISKRQFTHGDAKSCWRNTVDDFDDNINSSLNLRDCMSHMPWCSLSIFLMH